MEALDNDEDRHNVLMASTLHVAVKALKAKGARLACTYHLRIEP